MSRRMASAKMSRARCTRGDHPPPALVRGTAVLRGHPESFVARVARQVVGVLIRESGA